MKARAAVAWEAGQPLEIEMVDVEGPRDGEVLLRVVATGVCHTDAYTLSGTDPEGLFPAIMGHEGGAVVEEIGPDRPHPPFGIQKLVRNARPRAVVTQDPLRGAGSRKGAGNLVHGVS